MNVIQPFVFLSGDIHLFIFSCEGSSMAYISSLYHIALWINDLLKVTSSMTVKLELRTFRSPVDLSVTPVHKTPVYYLTKTKTACTPGKDFDQPGCPPSLISSLSARRKLGSLATY